MKTALVLLVAVVAAVGLGGCRSKLTAETTGQVTNSVLDRERKTKRKKTSSGRTKTTTKVDTETDIDYTYTVGGRSFSGFTERDGNVVGQFAIGSTVKVCYDPSNPEDSDLAAPGEKCE